MRLTCALAALLAPHCCNVAGFVHAPALVSRSSTAHQQRHARRLRMDSCAPTAAAERHGRLQYSDRELSVDDTLSVTYTPPQDFFREGEGLFYCGGYNGWDGEDTPVLVPMLRERDGRYRVSLTIPNFAKVLDFTVTDGVRYDAGPDEDLYHICVTHVQEADESGNILMYRQGEDGELEFQGTLERADPQALERMIDEGMTAVAESLDMGAISKDQQAAVQAVRAEASILGEQLGLGNMQVSEARDAFDFWDDETTGELSLEYLPQVLERMGLDAGPEETQRLVTDHVHAKRQGADTITLAEFMYLFAELDKADFGIDMV